MFVDFCAMLVVIAFMFSTFTSFSLVQILLVSGALEMHYYYPKPGVLGAKFDSWGDPAEWLLQGCVFEDVA